MVGYEGGEAASAKAQSCEHQWKDAQAAAENSPKEQILPIAGEICEWRAKLSRFSRYRSPAWRPR